MGKVKVIISDKQKSVKLPGGTRFLVRKACTATLKVEGFLDDAEINVTFVDRKEINEINLEFRSIDAPTDVLSFPLGENGIYDTNPESGAKMLGDVLICTEIAMHQAEMYGHGIEREIAYLTVHSVLHLLGYDHIDGGLQKAIMREKEELVLGLLGLAIVKE